MMRPPRSGGATVTSNAIPEPDGAPGAAYREAYRALESILWARVKMGKTFSGNPYLDPDIKRGLQAVAAIRGQADYLDALDGGEHV